MSDEFAAASVLLNKIFKITKMLSLPYTQYLDFT